MLRSLHVATWRLPCGFPQTLAWMHHILCGRPVISHSNYLENYSPRPFVTASPRFSLFIYLLWGIYVLGNKLLERLLEYHHKFCLMAPTKSLCLRGVFSQQRVYIMQFRTSVSLIFFGKGAQHNFLMSNDSLASKTKVPHDFEGQLNKINTQLYMFLNTRIRRDAIL